NLLSAGQNLARQNTPTAGWRGRQRYLVAYGGQAALYSRLSEDQSPANDARLALWAEPTPEQLLDSPLASRLSPRLTRARHGPGTGRQPSRHQSPHAGGGPRGGQRRGRAR